MKKYASAIGILVQLLNGQFVLIDKIIHHKLCLQCFISTIMYVIKYVCTIKDVNYNPTQHNMMSKFNKTQIILYIVQLIRLPFSNST